MGCGWWCSCVEMPTKKVYPSTAFMKHNLVPLQTKHQMHWLLIKPPFTLTLMAFNFLTNAHGPSHSQTSCRSPTCSLTAAAGSNQAIFQRTKNCEIYKMFWSSFCKRAATDCSLMFLQACHPSYTDKILSQLTVWAPNGCQSEMWLVPVSLTKRLFRCSNGS